MVHQAHLHRVRSAFTLIELLVVIGIIAVLVGILLPVMRVARAQAQMTVCQSNLRQIYAALQMYAYDNRDRWPDAQTLGRHAFRAAVGRGMPGRSPFLESYGLPALLHGIQPGAIITLPLPKPRYIGGDSNVWMCPAAADRIAKWGNTYTWSLWDPTVVGSPPAKKSPQVDYDTLERHRYVINDPEYRKYDKASFEGSVPAYLTDDVKIGAGLTGFVGPFSGTSGDDPYSFPGSLRPHLGWRKGAAGAINYLAPNGEIFTQLVKPGS